MSYVISIILLVIFIVIIFILRNKHKKELLNLSNVTIRQMAKEKINELTEEYYKVEEYYRNEKKKLEEEYTKVAEELAHFNNKMTQVKEGMKKEIEEEMLRFKASQYEILKVKLDDEERKLKNEIDKQVEEYRKFLEEDNDRITKEILGRQEKLQQELEKVSEEVKDYEKKREVINKQILMERERKEKERFFVIDISENDKADLKLIASFEEQFHNKEVLNRAVFDTFIKKPMNEMIKRVLEGRSPSGIYMITNILTNEIYIGRAVSVDKRWQEHCKSCFNIGTIAHSTLHTRMAKEGIWNFSFQLLEEVPKDKLSEREKYWINFYQTKEYGMNERAGG